MSEINYKNKQADDLTSSSFDKNEDKMPAAPMPIPPYFPGMKWPAYLKEQANKVDIKLFESENCATATTLKKEHFTKSKIYKVVKIGGLSLLGVFIFIAGMLIAGYFTLALPAPSNYAKAQITEVYFADKTTLLGTFAQVDRTVIDTHALPAHVRQAFLAAKEPDFFDKSNTSLFTRITHFWNDIKAGKNVANQSLTRRYVDSLQSSNYKFSWFKNIKLALTAWKANRQENHTEIFDNYLNTINFGRGAYGVEAAAKRYFGISAKELSVGQSALLASFTEINDINQIDKLAKQPEQLEKTLKTRWQHVLQVMIKKGWVDTTTVQSEKFPQLKETNGTINGSYTYLLQMIRKELINSGFFTATDIDTKGYTIVTTLDPKLQKLSDTQNKELAKNNIVVDIISSLPITGEVKALTVSDAASNNFDRDTKTLLGRGALPIVLSTYLNGNRSLLQTIPGTKNLTVINSFIELKSNEFLKLLPQIGEALVKQEIHKIDLGENITSLTPENVAQGNIKIDLEQKAKLYSVFAAQGVVPNVHLVASVNEKDKIIYTGTTVGKAVLLGDVANSVNFVLAKYAQKTKTLNSKYSSYNNISFWPIELGNKDGWCVGYTPHLLTVVQASYLNNDEKQSKQHPALSVSQEVFKKYMDQALIDSKSSDFPLPPSWALPGWVNGKPPASVSP